MQEKEHPRARGENRRAAAIVSSICGTSPRTRGKQVTASHQGNTAGNIPAHAGKTERHGHGYVVFQEHPRARGENLIASHHS